MDGSPSGDPGGDALTYAWTIEGVSSSGGTERTVLSTDVVADVTLPLGEHMVTLTVTDSSGGSGAHDVVVRVLAADAATSP